MSKNNWILVVGLVLLIVGSGPLITKLLMAQFGLTEDPNPNPFLYGVMAYFTFWPSLILIAIAVVRKVKAKKRSNLSK